jgi:diguanylate cyclase (GGDEF)-like protein
MSTVDRGVLPSPEVLEAIIAVEQQVAATDLGLDQVMRLALLRAVELTEARGAQVELVRDEDMEVRAAAGTLSRNLGERLGPTGSLSDQAMASGRAHLCLDAESDPRVDREACRRLGARSLVTAPIRTGRGGGVLKVVSDRPDAFDPAGARAVELLAGVISVALGRTTAGQVRSRQELQDPLTGLASRALFLDHLKSALARLARRRSTVSVLCVDLDGFDEVNGALGREVGDRLLVATGGRVREIVRGTDTVARFGGDDFAVLCENPGRPRGAAWVAERILEWLSRPFRIEGHEIQLSATIGIAVADRPEIDPETLLREAGQAMYAAKSDGKGCYRFARSDEGDPAATSYTGDTTA